MAFSERLVYQGGLSKGVTLNIISFHYTCGIFPSCFMKVEHTENNELENRDQISLS